MYVVVILILVLGLVAYVGLNYRSLVEHRAEVDEKRARLDEHLKRRQELVTRLVDGLSGELGNGREPADALASARRQAGDAAALSVKERSAAESALSESIGRFFRALQDRAGEAESENFARLRDEMIAVEDDLILTQEAYNRVAYSYNAQHRVFPTRLIADKLKLPTTDEFEIEDAFAKYPLKLKRTMPSKRTSFPGMDDDKGKGKAKAEPVSEPESGPESGSEKA